MKRESTPTIDPPLIRYDLVDFDYDDHGMLECEDGEYVKYDEALARILKWWERYRGTCLYLLGHDWTKPSFCEECMTEQSGDTWKHKPDCSVSEENKPR